MGVKERKRETDRQCVNGRWRKDRKESERDERNRVRLGFQVVGVEEIV